MLVSCTVFYETGPKFVSAPLKARRVSPKPTPMLPMVNRCAILLTPRAPYIAWANSLDDDGPRYEDDDAAADDSRPIFLGPDVDEPGQAARFVDKNFSLFFEEWLESWCTDESQWPKRRTRKMFREWFDVRIFELVHDTLDRPIHSDE